MKGSTFSNRILWMRTLWNGFLALILGIVLYMIPGIIIAFKMGFDLGPKLKNSQEVTTQISETISKMYQENAILTAGYIISTCLLILWRARVVTKGTGDKKLINGFLVGFIPALLGLLFIFTKGFNLISLVEIIVFIGSGLLGSTLQKKST
jgi:energy-coupling factor transporter transmembrane protein EcfT